MVEVCLREVDDDGAGGGVDDNDNVEDNNSGHEDVGNVDDGDNIDQILKSTPPQMSMTA